MKTSIQELIAKFTEFQRLILSNDEYAKGYDGALSDCINVAKSFLEQEKQQIIDSVNSQRQIGWDEKGEEYYSKTYKS